MRRWSARAPRVDDIRRRLDEMDGAAGRERSPRRRARRRQRAARRRCSSSATTASRCARRRALPAASRTCGCRPSTPASSRRRGRGRRRRPDHVGVHAAARRGDPGGSRRQPAFGYRLQLDAAEPPTINDAFVQWRLHAQRGLRAGQFKVPFGLAALDLERRAGVRRPSRRRWPAFSLGSRHRPDGRSAVRWRGGCSTSSP